MRITDYLSRVGKSRGFGIQSPWAYRFVTEVIGETLPYYGYADIEKQYASRQERRFWKLVLRVRNFAYPHECIVTSIDKMGDDELSADVTRCGSHGAIIVRDIMRDNATRERWEGIKADGRIGVTFDLYDFGICFLDTAMHKQHYKLNF